MSEDPKFHWADYLVFALCLAASAGFAIFSGLSGGKKDAAAVLAGGSGVKYPAVGMSIVASFLTAPFLLGTPAEIYYFGTMFYLTIIGYILAAPVVAQFFLKMFHKLKLPTAYKYFELRFHKNIRLTAAVVFVIQMLFFAGMVIYAPSLAFSQVTGLPLDLAIVGVGALCIVFTALGGLKAVIWIDLVYIIISLVMFLVLTIYGSIEAGGISHVWKVADEGGRLEFDVFDPNPLIRHTFWTQSVGGMIMTLVILVANQATVQKLLSLPELKDAQKAMWISMVFFIINMTLMTLIGLIMYSYYLGCDPTAFGRVAAKDQLLILFMMDLLGHVHGLPGLFTAAIFGLSLSPVAAGLNAIAGLLLFEFVMPLTKKFTGNALSPNRAKWFAKGIALVFGILTIAVAYLGELFGTTILQIALSIYATCGGPILGMMALGMFFPFATSWGAVTGMLVSLITTCWIMIGGVNPDLAPAVLPLSTDNCSWPDAGNITEIGATQEPPSVYDGPEIFKLSYVYYSLFAAGQCVVIGIIVSLLTGCICPSTRIRDLNEETVVCHCGCCFYCTATDSSYALGSDEKEKGVNVISKGVVQNSEAHELKDEMKIPMDTPEGQTNNGYIGCSDDIATLKAKESGLSETGNGDVTSNGHTNTNEVVSVPL